MKKTNWRKGLKKNPRTKNLLKWERDEEWKAIKKGLAVGLVLGSVGVLVVFFILVWMN